MNLVFSGLHTFQSSTTFLGLTENLWRASATSGALWCLVGTRVGFWMGLHVGKFIYVAYVCELTRKQRRAKKINLKTSLLLVVFEFLNGCGHFFLVAPPPTCQAPVPTARSIGDRRRTDLSPGFTRHVENVRICLL